jgi:serine/threonine protein kinase
MIETLGPYKILDRIGEDAIGEVYRARDTRIGRTVAVKVMPPDGVRDPSARARLLDQASAAMRLSHPNIAALYEAGEDQGRVFLACEFVPGATLKATINGRPLNPRRAIDYAAQIADALAEAHADDFVHCDLGADTIVITPKGNAKILDFAVPRVGDDPGRSQSPYRTIEGPGAGDYRDDIFSLGVILFEMVTGRLPPRPFRGDEPPALGAAAPAELLPIVSRAMASDPAARYQSAATLAAELRAVAAILDVRSRQQEVPRPRARRRAPWLPWIAALIALGGTGALIWLATRAA